MADKHDVEGSSSSNVTDRISDSIIELNVKTLDSQNYYFNVDRNITVLAFKEKVASQTGLPVVQQRLIFRGKVLKDNDLLSDYHVDSGHTLHLVERQPSVSQPSSGATTGGSNTNDGSRGQEPGVGGPRRIGQISHSIMLGTLNVGDQGEGGIPDISRVIGSVLNSIGIGSQMGGGIPGMQFSGPVTTPQVNETEGSRSGVGVQTESGNQSSNGQPFAGMSTPQAVQIPLGAAIAIPTLSTPIPDSLNTLSEFMNHMERAFGRNDPANQSLGSTEDLPRIELPTSSNGGATLEGLSIVLRQAEELIGRRAVAALSYTANCLEQEADSTDISVRGQIQAETGQLGLEMQHLGALFLELGRTILTTRLGRSPAESSVNAGPAVYISPSGPNPIMVQPFPLQTGSLFGSSTSAPVNSAVFGPPTGNIPRNVNIHIHAVGTRGVNGEGSVADRNSGSGDSGQTRDMPMRNVTGTATHSQPATISISSHPDASASQQHPSASLSSALSELNSRLRHLVDTMPSELRAPRDQSNNSNVDGQFAGNDANETTHNVETNNTGEERSQQAHDQELRPRDSDNAEVPVNFKEPFGSSAESSNILTGSSKLSADGASQSSHGDHQASSATPLGLGFGSLQPKGRRRQSKVQTKSGATSSQEQSRAVGQQVLQSLASLGNRQSTQNVPGGSLPSSTSSVVDSIPVGSQNTGAQPDIANTMSQILQSPALGGLLTGISQQTGLGSPDALRNMMGQLTQNPAMRNTVNQIAQQIDSHDLASMFSGVDSSQGGGIDLSRMMQQMMPIVTQALGGASSFGQSMPSVETQRPQSRPRRDVPPTPNTTQVDLRQVSRRIEERSPPQEVLRSLIENAINLDGVTMQENSLIELCSEDELLNDFMHMLCQDVSRRLDS